MYPSLRVPLPDGAEGAAVGTGVGVGVTVCDTITEPVAIISSSRVVNAESADVTFSGDITYTWYGPADGLITGAVKTVRYPAVAVFEGLAPGRRILKDSRSGRARTIDVKPGDNLVSIKLP